MPPRSDRVFPVYGSATVNNKKDFMKQINYVMWGVCYQLGLRLKIRQATQDKRSFEVKFERSELQ